MDGQCRRQFQVNERIGRRIFPALDDVVQDLKDPLLTGVIELLVLLHIREAHETPALFEGQHPSLHLIGNGRHASGRRARQRRFGKALDDKRVFEERHLREVDFLCPVLVRVDRLIRSVAFGDIHRDVCNHVSKVNEDVVVLLRQIREPVGVDVIERADSFAAV